MTPLLQVKALRKSYGALTVTDDLSLAVAPGQCHAIIGPNGAGKTTLVAQLSGQLRPDAGAILFDGRDITRFDMPARVRMGLARSFQITTLMPAMSVLDNVALAVQGRMGSSLRMLRAVSRETALNDEAMTYLEQVGLADRAGRLAGALSHGEKRQLELAVALSCRPRLLLLDEPLAGTGPQEADVLIDLLSGLKSRVTMVLIEHDMDAVFALADWVSVLVYGHILAGGAPDQIRQNPAVRAAYLGEGNDT